MITDLATLASLADEIATMEWGKRTSARAGVRVRRAAAGSPTGLTTGVPDRTAANAANIKATLDRLKEKAES